MSRSLEVAMWDPALYGTYAAERARPFFDLLSRVGADDPRLVVDLGCGPGELTAALASRWPAAEVSGIDSSAEMIEKARKVLAPGRLSFALGDIRTWRPDRPVDVIICNAVLQWVPDHAGLLASWAGQLATGGWLAFQVPGNVDQPAYQVLRQLVGSDAWRSRLGAVNLNIQGADPAAYLDLLARTDCDVDAWETTYLHLLHGDDPVLTWYLSTGLRPVLAALDGQATGQFLTEYGALLRAAYPAAAYGTVFPFRRVFVVAHRRR
jgi:trans-aconitate 2-methyltransferase